MPHAEPLEADAVTSGGLPTVRREHLPADLSSARRAREVVREVLRDAGRPEWLEACELATSEIVSNAVLHAHTDSTLTVTVHPDHVRVEVRDGSPVLPVQRDHGAEAATGRGMTLVAALTDEHGLAEIGPDGKTVWFTVSADPAEQSEEELLEAWADADWDMADLLEQAPEDQGATVWLLGLPPTLWLAAREHHDAIVRELVLHVAEHGEPDVDIAAADRARAAISTAVAAAVEQHRVPAPVAGAPSLRAGYAPLDLPLDVPDGLGPAFLAFQDALDVAERLARAGRLLTYPGLPEVTAVRDWACEQVTAQLAGLAPTAWPGLDHDGRSWASDEPPRARRADAAQVAAVRASARGVVAADEGNRILAVSRPLAALLGWSVEELVGRRLITLVPPHLREAHVAGFARHVATGEARILDVPLVVPVLRADGSELRCTLLVQHLPAPERGATYLGWIDEVVDGQ